MAAPVKRRFSTILRLLFYAAALANSTAFADWKDDIGYTRLLQTFPAEPPTSVANGVAQIEAGTSYLPVNVTPLDPNHPEFGGKTIVAKSGASGVSGHATSVAQPYYGKLGSIIPATPTIDVYSANPWMEAGFLIPFRFQKYNN
jgi:hypothetical protein